MIPARVLAVLLLGVVVAPLVAVAWRGTGLALGPADWAAVRFTLLQAAVSAALATVLAVPVARAIARRGFPGRGFLITLLGAPFLLPAVVAVLGLLAVFGRSGIVNQMLNALGLPPVSIFGLQGVVLVHQFRMIDPSQRGLTLIEQAPDDLVEEVRARVAAMLD